MIVTFLRFLEAFSFSKSKEICFDHNSAKSAIQKITQLVLKTGEETVEDPCDCEALRGLSGCKLKKQREVQGAAFFALGKVFIFYW